MFYVSISNNNDRAEFNALDDALFAISNMIDDIVADHVVHLYDDDAMIGRYRGGMERVDVDYPNDDFGPDL